MFAFKAALLVLLSLVFLVQALPVNRRTCKAKHAPKGLPSASKGSPAVLTASADHAGSPKATKVSGNTPKETDSPATEHEATSSNKLVAALFPVSDSGKTWSTTPDANNNVPLSDSTFRPTKEMKAIAPDYTTGPEGKKAMKAHYPAGSWTYQEPLGGISFYAPGPESVDLTTAKEATFGYSVYFPAGFAFNMGGKLPGLYGGDNEDVATSCSGGRRSDECFSARLMWRDSGKGELYTYLPPYTEGQFAANKKQCNVGPESDCNPTYGASVGRGAFKFATGQWTTVSERVRLNDVGQANGELELFVNGKSVIHVNGLILRARGAGKIRGIQMQTFFGGHDSSWASPKAQDVYFADFSVAITESL